MSTNKQALREAANGAEPEVWIGIEDDLNADGYSRAITRFIQHCSPATVLALLDELEARQANPINFKENADADYCRGWAWNEVKKELASEAWAVGDNCTFYGFFCWGWDSRRQFNEQRAAGITVKGDSE